MVSYKETGKKKSLNYTQSEQLAQQAHMELSTNLLGCFRNNSQP